jgi:LPS-assembly protein
MKRHTSIALSISITLALASGTIAYAKTEKTPAKPLSNLQIAKLLGWVKSDDPNCALCGGYYTEPKTIAKHPHPSALNKNATQVTAEGPTLFVANGKSILQKNVVVTQPGRLLKADKAYIYRDNKTGKITAIELVGHVYLQQKDKLIVGQRAYLDLSDGSAKLVGGIYHISYPNKISGKSLNAWGRANYIKRLPSGIIDLKKNVTYSTCPPIDPSWEIKASSMHLDKKKGVGSARNVLIRWHGIPIMYSPYYSFPLDARRKSGFLAPVIGYSSKTGTDISVPYYWNIAPNYDMTLTPRWISKRGVQLSGLFRFLSKKSAGELFASFLPDDTLFGQFKQQIRNNTPATTANQPYLDAINNTSRNRWALRATDKTQLSSQWSAGFNLNRVSDDYYLTDFDLTDSGMIANQLLNQVNINYTGIHWNFTGLLQGYQTLHPINQDLTQDQYQRLPELDLNANYPGLKHGIDAELSSSLVNFDYESNFVPNQPTGQRFHVRPGITLPFDSASGYFTPSFYIDNTDYMVRHPFNWQSHNRARTLPIVDVDTGLYFNRNVHWEKSDYIQTLQPEAFYLYVPYQDQDDIPNFDTYLLPFSFNTLFNLNRFTGNDRLQNANQLSLGVSSRIINSDTGAEKLKLDLGAIYYFTRPKVCLTPNCTASTNNMSPIIGDATFYPSTHWSSTATWAWDPNTRQTNNAGFKLNYRRDNSHLFSLGYEFINETDSPQYSDLTAGASWPISYHWGAVGYTYYNVSQHRPDSYYLGVQYHTCCWTLRLIAQRQYTGNSLVSQKNEYKTAYYVQLQLNGLGSVGNANADGLLTDTLPGYNPLLH